jgi:glycine cleavage system H protein
MSNSEFLETTIDKFVFRVAQDRRYTNADVWVQRIGDRVRIGITDFNQQKSGDVGFVTPKPVGTVVAANDEIAAIETIKVDFIVPAPLAGKIVAVNNALETQPELVNSDPYGEGWMLELAPANLADYDALLDAATYLQDMTVRAELERGK